MTKLLLFLVLLFSFPPAQSQQNFLAFKKRHKTITRFWKGSVIAFQLKDKEWRKGEITKIHNDSFFIRPTIVRYALFGTDTLHYSVLGFALSDVYAMPKRGYLIDFIDGRFQISKAGGHVHFYWVKSGLLFRIGAAGYAALNLINGLINNDFTLKDGKIAMAAVVFALGVLMKHTYKTTLRIRNKYHLKIIDLSGTAISAPPQG